VRGLSDRDVESLVAEAGLGTVSKSTVSRICKELRDRYRAFRARSLAQADLLVLFLDAIYLPTRRSRSVTYARYGASGSGTVRRRSPGRLSPRRYARIVFRLRPRCRAMAEIVQPRW
jgi:hypothetical protein